VIYGAFGARRPPLRALLWGAAATGSFLSGMSLGWLAVLQFGIEVGAAYGGSDLLGRAVLFLVYLYLVQFVLLVGYVVTLVLGRRQARPGSAFQTRTNMVQDGATHDPGTGRPST
jgi:membrane protein